MRHGDKLRLYEGLKEGDLEDMVLPLLSLDEYQSKITDGDDIVVLGFYVKDMSAADDLNRFVQKSAIDILDTERSPAPDSTGYYYVFVELPNNRRLGNNIASLLEEIGPLTNIEKWQVRVRGLRKIIPFDTDRINAIFERRRQRAKQAKAKSVTNETRLTSSRLRDIQSGTITEGLSRLGRYQVVDRGPWNKVLRRNNLDDAPISFAFRDLAECKRLEQMLGEGVEVLRIGDLFAAHDASETVLLKRA